MPGKRKVVQQKGGVPSKEKKVSGAIKKAVTKQERWPEEELEQEQEEQQKTVSKRSKKIKKTTTKKKNLHAGDFAQVAHTQSGKKNAQKPQKKASEGVSQIQQIEQKELEAQQHIEQETEKIVQKQPQGISEETQQEQAQQQIQWEGGVQQQTQQGGVLIPQEIDEEEELERIRIQIEKQEAAKQQVKQKGGAQSQVASEQRQTKTALHNMDIEVEKGKNRKTAFVLGEGIDPKTFNIEETDYSKIIHKPENLSAYTSQVEKLKDEEECNLWFVLAHGRFDSKEFRHVVNFGSFKLGGGNIIARMLNEEDRRHKKVFFLSCFGASFRRDIEDFISEQGYDVGDGAVIYSFGHRGGRQFTHLTFNQIDLQQFSSGEFDEIEYITDAVVRGVHMNALVLNESGESVNFKDRYQGKYGEIEGKNSVKFRATFDELVAIAKCMNSGNLDDAKKVLWEKMKNILNLLYDDPNYSKQLLTKYKHKNQAFKYVNDKINNMQLDDIKRYIFVGYTSLLTSDRAQSQKLRKDEVKLCIPNSDPAVYLKAFILQNLFQCKDQEEVTKYIKDDYLMNADFICATLSIRDFAQYMIILNEAQKKIIMSADAMKILKFGRSLFTYCAKFLRQGVDEHHIKILASKNSESLWKFNPSLYRELIKVLDSALQDSSLGKGAVLYNKLSILFSDDAIQFAKQNPNNYLLLVDALLKSKVLDNVQYNSRFDDVLNRIDQDIGVLRDIRSLLAAFGKSKQIKEGLGIDNNGNSKVLDELGNMWKKANDAHVISDDEIRSFFSILLTDEKSGKMTNNNCFRALSLVLRQPKAESLLGRIKVILKMQNDEDVINAIERRDNRVQEVFSGNKAGKVQSLQM